MKRFIPLLVLLLSCSTPAVIAQQTAKKTTKNKVVQKKKKAPAAVPDAAADGSPLMTMEGGKALYMGKTGDQLVYEVNTEGQVYNFIITLKPETDADRYSFDWEMTAPVNKQGHVNISKEAAWSSKKYQNYFAGGNLSLTDACTVWMTGINFAEMPEKKTTMQLDGDAPENFYRRDDAETEYKVLYKGKTVSLDIFKVDNGQTGGNAKQLWIQGISSFPLIVKMDLGWTIRLKEIK